MWVTIILSYIALTQVYIAGDVGDDCILDETNSIGTCVPINHCEVAFRAVKGPNKAHSFKRCGFEGLTEAVCCPSDSVTDSENKHGIGTFDEKRKLRIADKECEKIIESGKGVLSLYIIGGDDAQQGEFPHMVALGYTDGDGYKFGCGGSLISETYVLTAAHCVGNRLDTPPSIARLGIIHLGIENAEFNDVTDVRIAEVKLHPKRTPATKYHDLALLRLETPVKSNEVVNPICLYTAEADPTVPLTVTGWGQTSVSSARTKNITLQKADLYVMEREKCGEYYKISNKYWLKLPNGIVSEQMCAHHPQGLTDACQGDSGGPLQMMSGKNYRLVGITSFGSGCGSSKPGVYTKIFPYLDWIESVVWPQ